MKRLGYVPALDGLRGVAILLVLAAHFFRIAGGGAVGVRLFFVLSGFLITTLLVEEYEATHAIALGRFYVRRARRLFPALAMLLIVFLGVHVGDPDALERAGDLAVFAGLYFGNVVIAFNLHDIVSGTALGPLWSLAQEEQFYLLWPMLIAVGVRSRRLLTWLVLCVAALLVYDRALALAGASSTRMYYGPDTNAVWLVAGGALALIRRRGYTISLPLALLGPGLLGVYVASADLRASWLRARPASFLIEPVLMLACVAFVAAAYSPGPLAAVLSLQPLVWLGIVSYSLYLWHVPILSALGGYVPVVAPLSLLVAWLSYRYVEQPFRRRRAAPLDRTADPSAASLSG